MEEELEKKRKEEEARVLAEKKAKEEELRLELLSVISGALFALYRKHCYNDDR